jgi:hypothetical protein
MLDFALQGCPRSVLREASRNYDKEAHCTNHARQYLEIIWRLTSRKFFEGPPLPLLEGVHALMEPKLFTGREFMPGIPEPWRTARAMEILDKGIRELPTRAGRRRSSVASAQ